MSTGLLRGMSVKTAPPLRRDAAENRARILAAAIDVFGAAGAEAGIDDVARQAGVGIGTVYRRFPTKEALIDAIVAQLLHDVLDVARAALDAPAEEGLAAYLTGAGELQARHAGCLWQLWTGGDENAEVLPELRTVVQQLLTRAQHSGAVRADLSYEDIGMTLWSLAGVIESARDAGPDVWRRTLELILLGMKASAGPLHAPSLSPAGLQAIATRARQRRSS